LKAQSRYENAALLAQFPLMEWLDHLTTSSRADHAFPTALHQAQPDCLVTHRICVIGQDNELQNARRQQGFHDTVFVQVLHRVAKRVLEKRRRLNGIEQDAVLVRLEGRNDSEITASVTKNRGLPVFGLVYNINHIH
jgi:uroporphyrinogen-III synthase